MKNALAEGKKGLSSLLTVLLLVTSIGPECSRAIAMSVAVDGGVDMAEMGTANGVSVLQNLLNSDHPDLNSLDSIDPSSINLNDHEVRKSLTETVQNVAQDCLDNSPLAKTQPGSAAYNKLSDADKAKAVAAAKKLIVIQFTVLRRLLKPEQMPRVKQAAKDHLQSIPHPEFAHIMDKVGNLAKLEQTPDGISPNWNSENIYSDGTDPSAKNSADAGKTSPIIIAKDAAPEPDSWKMHLRTPQDNTKNHASRIQATDGFLAAAVKISEGHPGSMRVLISSLDNLLHSRMNTSGEGLRLLKMLETNGIYGPDIWLGYLKVSGENIQTFVNKLKAGTLKQEIDTVKNPESRTTPPPVHVSYRMPIADAFTLVDFKGDNYRWRPSSTAKEKIPSLRSKLQLIPKKDAAIGVGLILLGGLLFLANGWSKIFPLPSAGALVMTAGIVFIANAIPESDASQKMSRNLQLSSKDIATSVTKDSAAQVEKPGQKLSSWQRLWDILGDPTRPDPFH